MRIRLGQFIYFCEVSSLLIIFFLIFRDFLATAEDLKVSGLTPSRTGFSPATSSAVEPTKKLPAKNVSQCRTETADIPPMNNARIEKRCYELSKDEVSSKRIKTEVIIKLSYLES